MTRAPARCGLPALVVENRRICPGHYALSLRVAHLPDSHPGQFVQVLCSQQDTVAPASREWPDRDWPALDPAFGEPRAFLRRPFSIADRWRNHAGDDSIALIHRAIGPGTRWLEQRHAGETINLSGPFGRGFAPAVPGDATLLVGGGVGIPPLLYLARVLHACGAPVAAIFGARDVRHLPLDVRPERVDAARPNACVRYAFGADVPTLITTDDGSLGLRGRVTDGLRQVLADEAWRTARVCACGPEPMLRAVSEVTRAAGLRCELCIERMMGCGMGTCLSCVVRVRDPAREAGWRYALTCRHGPVFPRDELCELP